MEQAQISTKLKGQVLNQVYRVWLFRKLLPVLVIEVLVLSLILFQLGRAVFIQRIIENALKVFFLDPSQIIGFVVAMFAGASLSIKLLGFAVLILLALLLRHITQGMLRLFLVKENYFSRIRQ